MKDENEIAIDGARTAVKKFADLATHSWELAAKSAGLLRRSSTLCQRAPEANIVNSLKIDLKVGLTFAAIALERPERTQRNQRNARVAYETVLQQLGRMHLSKDDEREIQSRIAKLRTALRQLGESV